MAMFQNKKACFRKSVIVAGIIFVKIIRGTCPDALLFQDTASEKVRNDTIRTDAGIPSAQANPRIAGRTAEPRRGVFPWTTIRCESARTGSNDIFSGRFEM